MLLLNDAKRIGRDACVEAIGADFCRQYGADTGCFGWVDNGDCTITAFVGVTDEPNPTSVKEVHLREKPYKYMASCLVNLKDGKTLLFDVVPYMA